MVATGTPNGEPDRGKQPALVAQNGPAAGSVFRLGEGETSLGRHASCDIVVDVGAVSRYHCKVIINGPKAFIEDLASRGGTFVNDVCIEQVTVLKNGDRIRLCDVLFTFEEVEQERNPIQPRQEPHALVLELDALKEVSKSLQGAVTIDEVLPHLLDSLFRIFPQADRGFICLIDDSGTLVPRWTKFRRDDDEEIRVSRTIAERTMEKQEAILSSDSTGESRVGSTVCAALIGQDGSAMGILQLDSLGPDRSFDKDDLEVLLSLAPQASFAINNARIHEELLEQRSLQWNVQLAAEIQQAFLPDERPEVPGYDFFELFRAANQICGDYHDYVLLPDGRVVLIVGDVVGYRVAATMLAAKTSAEARFCLALEPHLPTAVAMLNKRLCRLGVNRFVTNLVVSLDTQNHQVTIVNAGHPPPIMLHADGSLDELASDTAGLPLGIIEDVTYEEVSIGLQPGESLLLFTDGIVTAMNDSDRTFVEKIRRMIESSDGSPRGIGEAVAAGLRRNLGDVPQDDDMCLIVFGRLAADVEDSDLA